MNGESPFFGDDGTPVGASWPDYGESEQVGAEDVARVRRECITRLLAFLADKRATPEMIGKRVFTMAAALGVSPFAGRRNVLEKPRCARRKA